MDSTVGFMYNLFYLLDQSGDINGDKILQGNSPYPSIESAQVQALSDEINHYSIERIDSPTCTTIVYIV